MEPKDIQAVFINTVIRLCILFLMVYISLKIVGAFLSIIVWAAIIATALYPVHKNLVPRVGGQ